MQVLSNTVAQALQRFYPSGEAAETAKLCKKINDFFDCLNVRSTTEHVKKRNPMLAPYASPTDSRFDWLQNDFLKYFEDWQTSTQTHNETFSGDEAAKMFLSCQTFKDLQITVSSIIEVMF